MNNDIAELTEKLHIFMTDHGISISGQHTTLVVEHLLELLTKNKYERGSPRARRTVLASIISCVDALNEQNLGLMKAAIWYQMDLLALLEAVPQSEPQIEAWRWQNDEEDHLESLANDCLVLIRAADLRALAAATPKPALLDYADYGKRATELAEQFELMFTRLTPTPRETVRRQLYDLFVEIDRGIWERVADKLTAPKPAPACEAPTTPYSLHCAQIRKDALEEAANAASTCDIRAIGEGAIRIRIANKIRALKSQLASVEPSK